MKRTVFLLFLLSFLYNSAAAQEKWSLERCVAFALTNNISVKQADVQARTAALTVKLNQAGLYPNLSLGSNAGYNFGRSINPVTNQFEDNQVFFNNYQLQSNVNLFNWFSQRHAIAASKLDKLAADAAVDKARNDIALNVAVAYLQTLLAYEQIEIGNVQVRQTIAQMDVIQRRVRAGALPELNLIEMQAQLARDSAAMITSQSTYQQNLIQLKALLSMDMTLPFDIEKPDVTAIPIEPLASLQPDFVYAEALKNLPQQRVNKFRYEAAISSIRAARSSMYPTLSAFMSVQSNFSNRFPDETRATEIILPGYDPSGRLFVETAPGVYQDVYVQRRVVSVPMATYGKQVFDINLGQRVGLSLSVPIFQNRQLRTNYDRARLNAEGIRLQLDQDNLNLQADIYNAHTNAVNAHQRFLAARKAVEASQKALDFSQKRYDAGLLTTFELITNQNNLFRARLDATAAQYEYVFRMKLLEFYKGQGLKL